MANPWSRFFWSDWLADPGLRLCSLEARGLWMDMLCLCAAADPVGHLVNGTTPISQEQLSRISGGSTDRVGELLAELESHRVFSRSPDGVIYSRRMVQDAERSRINSQHGKMGGNRALLKDKENPVPLKPPPEAPLNHTQGEQDKPDDNPEDNREDKARARASTSTSISISRILGKDSSPSAPDSSDQPEGGQPKPAKDATLIAEFIERFWPAYPRKIAKPAAQKSFIAARKKGATLEQILAGVERYKTMKPEYADWAHATTWLNQGRWADEPDSVPAKAAPPPPKPSAPDAVAPESLTGNDKGLYDRLTAIGNGLVWATRLAPPLKGHSQFPQHVLAALTDEQYEAAYAAFGTWLNAMPIREFQAYVMSWKREAGMILLLNARVAEEDVRRRDSAPTAPVQRQAEPADRGMFES